MNIFIFIFSLASTLSLACDNGLVKRSSFEIPIGSPYANSMAEKDFKKTLKDFESFFSDHVDQTYQAEIQVIGSWSSNTVNAYADQSGKAWLILINGGLARHKDITPDGLKAVLCHELGHHAGGYPKKSTNRWSSAEGQADYYATMKCLRRLWEKEDNILHTQNTVIPDIVKRECALTYASQSEQALCQRMSLAGKSVALLIQDLDHDSITPKFETPDPEIVRTINYMYPYAQCRLDTFFNGALCSQPKEQEFANEDETIGACHGLNGDLRGLRPQCWFMAVQ